MLRAKTLFLTLKIHIFRNASSENAFLTLKLGKNAGRLARNGRFWAVWGPKTPLFAEQAGGQESPKSNAGWGQLRRQGRQGTAPRKRPEV
jgi:hypothetical protein